jgi:hypothetical protein
MARNLKKFVNPKFTRTVDLDLLRRLLQRHAHELNGLELGLFEARDRADEARHAVQDFFAGPEDSYPEGLVADLHRIAELGNSAGLDIVIQQANRLGIQLRTSSIEGDGDAQEDPKHVALRVFLDHPEVFDGASDMIALMARTSFAEFAGEEEGVEANLEKSRLAGFESVVAAMFERDMRSGHCRVGCYDDADEINLIIEHGAPVTTQEVLKGDRKQVISFRAAEHAILSYSAMTGRLKISGVAKARGSELAEFFAGRILAKPGFFSGEDAQNLYTLEPIQRAGFSFTFNHAFDPGIQRVQITEVQVDRLGTDPRTGETRTFYSYVARDGRDNALLRLGELMHGARLGADWRLNHIVIRVHFATGSSRPKKVTVKLKPPAQAMFKRQQFEARIMTLLKRNGLLHERNAGPAAIAAE